MLPRKWCLNELKSLLQTSRDEATISGVHAAIIKSGLLQNENSGSMLIASYSRTGNIDLAHQVFDDLPVRNVSSWNSLLVGYSKTNAPLQALSLYKEMRLGTAKPDSSTFTVAINACTALKDAESGEDVWRSAVESGYGDDVFVSSSMLSFYATFGQMGKAMDVFKGMSKRDVVSWSTMITGFVKIERPREALEMYRKMVKEGIESDGVAMLAMVQACAHIGDLNMASSLHGYMIRRWFPMNGMLQTSLIDMYSKNGKLHYGSTIFRYMSRKNEVSWGVLVSGYVHNGYPIEALELLADMQRHGFWLDEARVVSALLASSQVGLTLLGKEIHGYVIKNLDLNEVLGTALIDTYAKCGMLTEARLLYDRMSSRDLILLNTIIASYGIHGQGQEALSLFLQMIESDIRPDDATFASLLSALSHSGMVEEGQRWFNIMVEDYKIEPMQKHYVSLVDLLARAGQVEKARNLIGKMECEPGLPAWVALLSGCLKNKKFSVGEFAASKVVELKPSSPGIYALASNFFAAARKWDKVLEVRQNMKAAGIRKEPGFSVVELKGMLHRFLAEDTTHPRYVELEPILEELKHEMRAMGYKPRMESVLHNVDEDVKVSMLWSHSERLAIAFGILNTKPGTKLRITKNLRVCEDCHETIKCLSVIAKREIIVRDMKRFHHFKNGKCSCNDYW